MPILTVIMPAYNAALYIEETLNSFINQNFKDWKLIVFDDASTDNTTTIVQNWVNKDSRIQLIKNEKNLQVAKTMNLGIKMVESPYFARVDSDDVLLSNHFEKIISFLESNSEIDVCGSQVITIDSESKFRRKWNYETDTMLIKMSSIFACPFLQSSVVMRSTVIKDVNGYRPEMELIEDYELWIRILQKYRAANIQDYTIQYRIHDSNMSEVNKIKILKILQHMFLDNIDNYPIDVTNLNLHAKMEVGEWQNFEMHDFKSLKMWRYNLLEINLKKNFYDKYLYKDLLNKYFTNAYLKIATQNKGKIRFLGIIKAVINSPMWFIKIINRKKENSNF
ncbi:MAG: hypothetical protein DI598_18825 [Pseudopedobacter saltans]|uniref:Glycosyltransferase 2-like domain-containing protein n=1 Tax=Pseudopedobacter saltans TaxID=151895 RepID=A0A2W5G644_9SPHI|nr:MAG: hypothetical protein DI598_18825 [Pseudopedobacter saltans]